MISCYRLSTSRYPSNSGRGAALAGGRWNPIGMEAIYAAATPSLAVLEVLVHFSTLPHDHVLTEIEIPTRVSVETVRAKDLPVDWQALSPKPMTQEFGRRWANELRSAVLVVPSSIMPMERNYVINPLHPDFFEIKFLPSTAFRFDPRLK